MTDIRHAAIVQMRSGVDPEANLDALEGFVSRAAADGAGYVLTPEMSVVFAENRAMLVERAEPEAGGAASARLAEIARAAGIWLHVGSMAVALDDGRFANRSLLFAPDGAIAARYDKIHLFDADLPGQNAYRESATYRGGETAVVTTAPGFALGFSICYDLRFAALYRALAQAGAQVLSVPAAFTVPTGEAHWEVLLRARAIETGCYVIAAAQGGTHENGRSTYGRSMIVAPWGEVVARADGDAPGLVSAEIDLGAVASAHQRVPALANGRDFMVEVDHKPFDAAPDRRVSA
ncbi:carbon-nitrogen hydrolase family protein [Pelagibacterium montanilacus]|uniref:carbon-nitrogen hydrolase family protein n=1 Tax=Pelagibacterium montanilacus TaxID=2185280 RepID=UPI000F8F7195|nr:carbon-nitrogen hydrolase family protein [Pelagibacterium montanilacus]